MPAKKKQPQPNPDRDSIAALDLPAHGLAPAAGREREAPLASFPHSITTKNVAIFLVIFLTALLPLSVSYWEDASSNRIERLADQLGVIAGETLRRVDPAAIIELTARMDDAPHVHRRLVRALNSIQRDFGVDNAVLIQRQADGGFVFLSDGNGAFKVGQRVFLHDEFPETYALSAATWEGTGTRHTNLFGRGEFEYLQYYAPVRAGNTIVAVLLINKFAEDVDQAIRAKNLFLLALTGGIALVGLGVFWHFSNRLLRPLLVLRNAANRMARGDLAVQIPPLGRRDEVSELNRSFAHMVTELRNGREELLRNHEELKRTLARVQMMEDLEKNLSKLVPREVRRALDIDPEALERSKTRKDVSVLFLDVEGSTRLTQKLDFGETDRMIQRYFSRYLDIIYENHGDITETAGDGLMLIFQSSQPHLHALNAVQTALAIERATREINASEPDGQETLQVNIGISSGPAMVGFTKYEALSGTRITFTASGLTTIMAARLQDHARGGRILVANETWNRVVGQPDFMRSGVSVVDLGEVSLKNLDAPEYVRELALLSD